MTPEKLRKIDALVAEKVMGWTRGEGLDSVYWGTPTNHYAELVSEWTPSTYIDDAWTVVEKMVENGWNVTIANGEKSGVYMKNKVTFAANWIAGKPKEAICLCALKAVGETVEEFE